MGYGSILEADGGISSLAFAPSGQVIAIGGENGDIIFLQQDLTDLNKKFFTQLICGKVNRNMTQAQWAEYAPSQPYQKTCP